MSLVSTLALLLTAAVKSKPREDPARAIAELRAEADDWRRTADALRRECNDWRARAEVWRERAVSNIPAAQPAGPDFRPPELAQLQAQAQAQLAQYLQQQQMAQAQQWCNCVPSRAQVWAANGAEA